MEDYTSSFVGLDVSYNNLPTMRTMLAKIKSEKFPHLSLFHSIDPSWKKFSSRGDYTFLYMPHLAEEARIMMGNLIPYLRFKHGDGVLDYFLEEDRIDAKDDTWDDENKRVICTTDENMDIEEKEDGIGLDEATKFLEDEKAAIKKDSPSKATRSDPKAQLGSCKPGECYG